MRCSTRSRPSARAFALRLVQTTDRFFNVAAGEGNLAEIIRTRVAPIVLPQMVRFEAARDYILRTISQITLNYRGRGLDEGHAGPVHGGDRLPWVKMGGTDNYQALKRIGWQIHIYGKADDYVKRWAQDRRIPLEVYAWTEAMRHAGLRENASISSVPTPMSGWPCRPHRWMGSSIISPRFRSIRKLTIRVRARRGSGPP